VLCTIPHPAIALQRMHQWLKPGGKLIILEHIHGQSKMRRAVHTMLNPLWKHAAEGCHLTRDTDKLIPKMGFIAQKEDYFTKVLPFLRSRIYEVGSYGTVIELESFNQRPIWCSLASSFSRGHFPETKFITRNTIINAASFHLLHIDEFFYPNWLRHTPSVSTAIAPRLLESL
jgi:hypothetical protein